MMFADFRLMYRSRDLLQAWTLRTIRGRYQQSLLGWLWAVVQPVAQVLIFSFVFTFFVHVDTGSIPYPIFSFVAVLPWTFLVGSLPDMTSSLVDNMSLVTKIYFPREMLPVAAMLARLMDFGIGIAVLAVMMIFYAVPLFLPGLLMLPIILGIQIVLILGIGLAASALNVFLRDVRSLLALGLQLWFYASPIIYPVSAVPEAIRPFYYLNPMVGIIESYRDVLLHGRMPGSYLAVSAVISVLLFVLGYWIFKRIENQFADIV